MPTYSWSGRDTGGTSVTGTLDSSSPDMAAATLAGRGITPLKIEPALEKATESKRWFGGSANLSSTELQLFSRQLQALLRAGLPIMRALGAMQESATRPTVGRVLG